MPTNETIKSNESIPNIVRRNYLPHTRTYVGRRSHLFSSVIGFGLLTVATEFQIKFRSSDCLSSSIISIIKYYPR
jgi:hypothetical protein